MDFDAVTVAPYMGSDSILPFLKYSEKFTIVLGLTSNASASEFQLHGEHYPMYKEVLSKTARYAHAERLMYVVGATKAEALQEIKDFARSFFINSWSGCSRGFFRRSFESWPYKRLRFVNQ